MNSPETQSAVSSKRRLDEAEARWNDVTLREECASLKEIDAAWDDLEIARREYGTALSANAGSAPETRSLCEIRPGIGLCDECGQPKWPQKYEGYGNMLCLDCLATERKAQNDNRETL